MSIFESLEEKNLFLIEKGQDIDQILEEKMRQFAFDKKVKQGEISQLEDRLSEIQSRYDKTLIEYTQAKRNTVDDQTHELSSNTQ